MYKNQEHAVIIKKSSNKHGHDEHSSAWKVAFADFCLALSCLFLVLWILASRDAEEAINEVQLNAKTMIGEYQNGVMIEKTNKTQIKENINSSKSSELQQLADKIDEIALNLNLSHHLLIIVNASGLRVVIHDTDQQGMFKVGSSQPEFKFAQLLREIGNFFNNINHQLIIVGHTDSLAFSNNGIFTNSNWSLSSERALAARSFLLDGGMENQSVLQVTGMADVAPIIPENTKAAINRRVELLITNKNNSDKLITSFSTIPEKNNINQTIKIANKNSKFNDNKL